MIGADADPAGVRRHVIDSVRNRFLGLAGEVVRLDSHGLPCGTPFVPGVLVVADQLLLLAVHADHRVTGVPVVSCLLIEVAELGVPVGALSTLDGLGVGLQTEAFLPQQAGDRVGADPVALPRQLRCQLPSRLRRPPQRRHRVAPLVGLDQRK